jgi:preprotein translocase subunit SecY
MQVMNAIGYCLSYYPTLEDTNESAIFPYFLKDVGVDVGIGVGVGVILGSGVVSSISVEGISIASTLRFRVISLDHCP